jgi:hypothetical protein
MELYEKQEILDALEKGSRELTEAVEGLSDEQAARSPGPDRWSVLQCVEHLAIAEDYLFGQIGIATRQEAPVVNLKREDAIRERGADRARRVSSPAQGVPTGRFATLSEALRHFLDSRARTIRFVRDCDADLRAQLTSHPIIPTVNCHEMLLMIAAHPRRHADQIREVRRALNASTGRPS